MTYVCFCVCERESVCVCGRARVLVHMLFLHQNVKKRESAAIVYVRVVRLHT